MLPHWYAVSALLFVPFFLPAVVHAQSTHGEETETIEPPATREAPDAAKPDLDRVSELIVQLTNEFRRQQGRTEVKPNARLMATARYFADYMARTDRYGHTADGNQPWDRAKKHGYEYCVIAENIAYDYSSAGFRTEELGRSFVEGWKHSPPHRKNMLDPDVTETGVAVAHSDKTGYYYAVQMFGRPASDRLEFAISNRADTEVDYKLGERTFRLPPGYTRTHQQCRPTELSLHPAEKGTSANARTLKPANGNRYIIEQVKDGKIQVKTEKRADSPGQG